MQGLPTLGHFVVLLQAHYDAQPWPEWGGEIGHTGRILHELEALTLVVPNAPNCYRTTGRGACLVEHIRNLPLPENRWSMPDGTQ